VARDFSLLQNVKTEAYTASYLMGSGALSTGVKQPACELKHSPPSSGKFKNEWNYTFIPSICLHGSDGENLTCALFGIDCLAVCSEQGTYVHTPTRT